MNLQVGSSGSVDVVSVQQQAVGVADRLDAVWTGQDLLRSAPLGAMSRDEKRRIVEEVLDRIYQDATSTPGEPIGSREEVRAAALDVRSALQSPSTRSVVCRALRAMTSKNPREITFEVVKIGLPLAVAGQIAIPATALVWGILGFAVAAVGAAWLCGDSAESG